ncbi:MAG: Sec-independent protein translocase protein TatB [Burkholderiaceae bacterium]
MFDLSFSELLLIGVVALIVIGPERLPKVARTIGHLVGRAQRYVSNVKTDIQREMDISELNTLKNQMQDAADSVKSSMADASSSLQQPIQEAQDALRNASSSVESLVDSARAQVGSPSPSQPPANLSASAGASTASGTSGSALASAGTGAPGNADSPAVKSPSQSAGTST